ncbi:MAG: DUF5522 domain-containing protein [Cytophagales bacterium]|nr:DUF5522 domain-containing protein [Cytophagales bacterium]
MMKKEPEKEKKSERESPDFYWENGFMVFTEAYHRRRGYCCQSGCRHCPYGFKKETAVDR